MEKPKPKIDQWFWDILDRTRPNLDALAKELEQLPAFLIEGYYGLYIIASQSVCDAWDGPFIDDDNGYLSEDGTEDLTDWIVSQGEACWLRASRDASVLPMLFWQSEDVNHKWNSFVSNNAYRGYQSPKLIALAVYETKFGRNLYDKLDAILDSLENESDV